MVIFNDFKKQGENMQYEKHGMYKTKIYEIWKQMKARCLNKNNSNYARYGGRGIKIYDEWNKFIPFYKWAIKSGYDENAKHGKCTIDRIKNDGNYEPTNCRWITLTQQNRNTSYNRKITYQGETKCIVEWAEKYNIDYGLLWKRLRMGWDIEKALLTPRKENYVRNSPHN